MELAAARAAMVQHQIEARGVRDLRVLEAMRAVPRHVFIPEGLRDQAYEDHALAIGDGQTISQPYMVAVMTEALALEAQHRVLEIGTGSGYQTAILARLSRMVFSMERHPRLADLAGDTLRSLGVTNVAIHVGDGSEGLAERAPFDRILVTAGAPTVPAALEAQLTIGGRLVIPVGPPGYQHLTTIERRQANDFHRTESIGCVFVPLIGKQGWPD